MVSNRVQQNADWALDKRINLATGINLIQLLAVVWFGASFYTQVNANQVKNDDRFIAFAEQRKLSNDQMAKMQEDQGKVLVQISAMTERVNAQTDVIKDIRELLRPAPAGKRQ